MRVIAISFKINKTLIRFSNIWLPHNYKCVIDSLVWIEIMWPTKLELYLWKLVTPVHRPKKKNQCHKINIYVTDKMFGTHLHINNKIWWGYSRWKFARDSFLVYFTTVEIAISHDEYAYCTHACVCLKNAFRITFKKKKWKWKF